MRYVICRWLAYLCLCVSLIPAPARADDCISTPATIDIAFINGVLVSPTEYQDNKTRVQREYGPIYTDSDGRQHLVNYPDYYNPTEGVGDLLELLEQLNQQVPGWRNRVEVFYARVLGATLLPPYMYRPDLNPILLALGASLYSATLTKDPGPLTQELAAKTRNLVDDHHRVLMIAHSQGNMFANAISTSVEAHLQQTGDESAFRVVHVAPPAPIDELQHRYVTIKTDEVIKAARLLGSQAPKGTHDYPHLTQILALLTAKIVELMGHDFVHNYMDAPQAPYQGIRAYMDADMKTLVQSGILCVDVDPRGTWIVQPGIPSYFPPNQPPVSIDLAAAGLRAGDVLEVSAYGLWYYSGYWGQTVSSTGATGVFSNDIAKQSPSPITSSDPGSAPQAAPDPTIPVCSSNTAIDIPQDFQIPDGGMARVKVPPLATHLLLGVSDCYNGDNTGNVHVVIRKLFRS